MMWQLVPVGIAVACLMARLSRDCRRGWVAGILLANWALCTIGVRLSGDAYPVDWFASVDWLSALLLLGGSRMIWGRANLTETLVAAIYAAELVCHGWQHCAANPAAAKYAGWFFLRDAALAQLLVLAGWWIYGFSRRIDLPWRGVKHSRHVRNRDSSHHE